MANGKWQIGGRVSGGAGVREGGASMATDHFSILDYQFTAKRRLGLGTAQAMVS